MTGMSEVTTPEVVAPRAGADEGVADLYREHWASLVRLACLLVDGQAEAEEVVQDALIKVHGAWHRIRDEQAAVGYLRQAVLNGARSRLRRRAVARRHLTVVGDGHAPASTEDTVILREEHRDALAALRALPARQRECLALRYFFDLTDAEVADSVGISLGSAKTHLRRGLEAVTQHLEARA